MPGLSFHTREVTSSNLVVGTKIKGSLNFQIAFLDLLKFCLIEKDFDQSTRLRD